mgnify:FL=1
MSRHDHTLPMDANPLAKAVGERIRLVIEERGIPDKQAAKQMGVHHVRLGYLLRGAQVPTEAESLRIAGWMYEAKDFTEDPLPQTPSKVRKGKGFKKVSTSLDPKTLERATRASKRLGIGLSSLLTLAMERLLDHEPIMNTFEEAARRLNRARVAQYLMGDEHLRIILEGDIDIAVQMGGELRPARGRPPVMHTHKLLEESPDLGEDEWEIIE